MLACFPVLGAGCMFSSACQTGCQVSNISHWLHVIQCLAHVVHMFNLLGSVSMFHLLSTDCMFSLLGAVACFPVLSIGCMISFAWHWLHVFLCMALVACISVLGISGRFSSAYWH